MKACEHKNAREYARTVESHAVKQGQIVVDVEYGVAHLKCATCGYMFSRIAPGDLARGAA